MNRCVWLSLGHKALYFSLATLFEIRVYTDLYVKCTPISSQYSLLLQTQESIRERQVADTGK